jgi:hypothetical protein
MSLDVDVREQVIDPDEHLISLMREPRSGHLLEVGLASSESWN